MFAFQARLNPEPAYGALVVDTVSELLRAESNDEFGVRPSPGTAVPRRAVAFPQSAPGSSTIKSKPAQRNVSQRVETDNWLENHGDFSTLIGRALQLSEFARWVKTGTECNASETIALAPGCVHKNNLLKKTFWSSPDGRTWSSPSGRKEGWRVLVQCTLVRAKCWTHISDASKLLTLLRCARVMQAARRYHGGCRLTRRFVSAVLGR